MVLAPKAARSGMAHWAWLEYIGDLKPFLIVPLPLQASFFQTTTGH